MPNILQQCQQANIPVVISRTSQGQFDNNWASLANTYFINAPATITGIENTLIEALSGEVMIDRQQEDPKSPQLYCDSFNILVAEDNKTNQIVIQSLLNTLKQTTTIVADGKQALTAYCAQPKHYDLIFMDCEMPEMDGYEATRLIRQYEHKNNLAPISIYALTAHAMDENQQRCLDAGMNGVMIKPIKLGNLSDLLASHSTKPENTAS